MKLKSVHSNEIVILFKVWCPQFNHVDHRLFLLGSLKELGAWNLTDALEAYATTDNHIWYVEVAIPPLCQFEWVWLITNLNRSNVEWERPVKRNRTVDCFSGTLHTIWGNPIEVFHQASTCVELTTFMNVEDGYTMVLYGSTPTTGSWDIHNAIPATEFPKKSGYWKVQIAFDALTKLDFKWAVVKEKDRSLRVQEKTPHSIFGRMAWMRAVAPWMTPHVVVVDTPILCEKMDNKLGRTDILVNERKRRAEEIKAWLVATGNAKALANLSGRRGSFKTLTGEVARPPTVSPSPTQLTPPSGIHGRHSPAFPRKTIELDEQIRKRTENLSKTERVTQQLNKDFTETPVNIIKGVGQVNLPSDALNDGSRKLPVNASQEEYKVTGHIQTSAKSAPLPVSTEQKQKPYKFDGNLETRDLQRHSQPRSPITRDVQIQAGEIIDAIAKGVPCNDEDIAAGDSQASSMASESFVQLVASESPRYSMKLKSVSECEHSDTGVFDVSSRMSGDRINDTVSEYPMTPCSMPHVLPEAEMKIMLDADEGYSESVAPIRSPRSKMGNEMKNYWEIHQRDLSPRYLDDLLAIPREDPEHYLSSDYNASEEDDEHLEWLACKLEEEDTYCMSKRGLGFDIPPDHPFFGNMCFMSEGRLRQGQFVPSSPPKQSFVTSPVLQTLNTSSDLQPECFHDDTLVVELAGATKATGFSLDLDWTLRQDGSCFPEDDPLAEKRLIARALEEHWGASCGVSGRSSSPQQKPLCSLEENPETNKFLAFCSSFSGGAGESFWPEGERYKMAYYSFEELSGTIGPREIPVDHRAKARELERVWGESQRWGARDQKSQDAVVTSSAVLASGDA